MNILPFLFNLFGFNSNGPVHDLRKQKQSWFEKNENKIYLVLITIAITFLLITLSQTHGICVNESGNLRNFLIGAV